MKNQIAHIALLMSLLLVSSCSNNDDTEPIFNNSKNVTDCSLSYSANPNEYFIGVCVDGTNSALPNEVITFASKATPNFTEIVWTIESGSMELINIENSVENDIELGRLKSIATVQFNSNFTGGILRANAINDIGENAEMRHFIETGNNP